MRRLAGIIGSLAVGFLMTVAGLAWDVHTLTIAGLIMLGLTAMLWLVDWGRPAQASIGPVLPETGQARRRAGRVYLESNVTQEFLSGLYKDKTAIQGEMACNIYIGKWMRISGNIQYIEEINKDYTEVYFSKSHTFMLFASNLRKIEMLQKNDHIIVDGRLKRISPEWISLELCELVGIPARVPSIPLGLSTA